MNYKVYFQYKKAQNILANAQALNIIIEPFEPLVQKAINLLLRVKGPNYLEEVSKIVVTSASGYGFVESGPDKDPTVINIDSNKIKNIINQGASEADVIIEIAVTIAHEVGHVKSFDPQQGFVGGEGPAEASEQDARQSIEQQRNSLQDILGEV